MGIRNSLDAVGKEKSLALLENQTTVSLISSSKQRVAHGTILHLLIIVSLKNNRGIKLCLWTEALNKWFELKPVYKYGSID